MKFVTAILLIGGAILISQHIPWPGPPALDEPARTLVAIGGGLLAIALDVLWGEQP